jgi:hypothetical protein
MGRPRVELTDEQVVSIEKLAAVLSIAQIADFLGIGERTFGDIKDRDERVSAAYKKGKANAIANVAKGLLQRAIAGDNTAAIFYLKTQAQWNERVELAVTERPAIRVILSNDGDG